MCEMESFMFEHKKQCYFVMTKNNIITITKDHKKITENILGKSDVVDNFLSALINTAIEHRDYAYKNKTAVDSMKSSVYFLRKFLGDTYEAAGLCRYYDDVVRYCETIRGRMGHIKELEHIIEARKKVHKTQTDAKTMQAAVSSLKTVFEDDSQ